MQLTVSSNRSQLGAPRKTSSPSTHRDHSVLLKIALLVWVTMLSHNAWSNNPLSAQLGSDLRMQTLASAGPGHLSRAVPSDQTHRIKQAINAFIQQGLQSGTLDARPFFHFKTRHADLTATIEQAKRDHNAEQLQRAMSALRDLKTQHKQRILQVIRDNPALREQIDALSHVH